MVGGGGMMLRRTVLYLPASTLGPALQIVAVLVLTHWLSPGDIGLYALIVAAQDLIGVAGLVWWSHYVLRYLAPSGDPGRIAQDRTELAVLAVSALAQALLAAGQSLAGV